VTSVQIVKDRVNWWDWKARIR